MHRVSFTCAALALLGALAGCGGKVDTSTPEGAARAYLNAVQAGDAQALAQLYDYAGYARVQNPDWDSIPQGQRDLIIRKLTEERAAGLRGEMSQLQTKLQGASVGSVQTQGDRATASLGAGGSLTLVKQGEKWYIAGP